MIEFVIIVVVIAVIVAVSLLLPTRPRRRNTLPGKLSSLPLFYYHSRLPRTRHEQALPNQLWQVKDLDGLLSRIEEHKHGETNAPDHR